MSGARELQYELLQRRPGSDLYVDVARKICKKVVYGRSPAPADSARELAILQRVSSSDQGVIELLDHERRSDGALVFYIAFIGLGLANYLQPYTDDDKKRIQVCLPLLQDLAAAMSAIHSLGIIHRFVFRSPANRPRDVSS